MEEREITRESQEQGAGSRRNWRIGAWLPWVVLHILVSYLVLNSGGPGRGAIELLVYTAFSWGLCLLVILIFLFHRKNVISYLITICLLVAGPILSSQYKGTKNGEIIRKARAAAEEVERLCEERGGDKIYRRVEGVEGVLQMVPMPDYREGIDDQFGRVYPWHRYAGERSSMSIFTASGGEGYLFVEHYRSGDSEAPPYLRTLLKDSGRSFGDRNPDHPHPDRPILVSRTIEVNRLRSRYGWLSEDLTTRGMRERWIGGGRVKIIDLQTNEILAERTGFFLAMGRGQYPWYSSDLFITRCFKNDTIPGFLKSVLIPVDDYPTREKLISLRE